MRLLETVRLAVQAIRGHRLRSGLTTLGVIIGIAAVITFVTLGTSLQAGIIGDISPGDQRNVYGWAADEDAEGGPLAGAQPVFTQRDVERLSELDDVAAAYGYSTLPTQSVGYRGARIPLGDGVITAGPSYVGGDDIERGRQFRMGQREAVVNPAFATQFPENVSVGDRVTVEFLGGRTSNVTVVGITETSEGLSPFEGFQTSARVYLPTDPFYTDLAGAVAEGAGGSSDEVRFLAIVVEATGTGDGAITDAKAAARGYLQSPSSDASQFLGAERSVILRTSTELLQQLQDVLDLLQNFVVGIAAISLLVGSIGIANIMLVSVTERTREIGIMKAVGAQNRDVLQLFLTESVILGVLGALLGTLLGLAGGYLLAWYVDLPLVYPVEYVALAVAVGILVGIVAGLYPAWRAARTDPIDALRYE
ncbi:ABC transporter permease [Halobacteriales archaeon Cl-PHB]